VVLRARSLPAITGLLPGERLSSTSGQSPGFAFFMLEPQGERNALIATESAGARIFPRASELVRGSRRYQ